MNVKQVTDAQLDQLLQEAGFVRLTCHGRQNMWQSPHTHIVPVRRGNKHSWGYVSSLLTMGQVPADKCVTLYNTYFAAAPTAPPATPLPSPPRTTTN